MYCLHKWCHLLNEKSNKAHQRHSTYKGRVCTWSISFGPIGLWSGSTSRADTVLIIDYQKTWWKVAWLQPRFTQPLTTFNWTAEFTVQEISIYVLCQFYLFLQFFATGSWSLDSTWLKPFSFSSIIAEWGPCAWPWRSTLSASTPSSFPSSTFGYVT